MSTQNFNLPNDLNSSSSVISSLPNRLNNIVDTQIPGIFSIFGAGVIPNTDDNDSLLVTDGGGLSVVIDAGAAILPMSNGALIWAKQGTSYNLTGLEDDTDNYIYAKAQAISGNPPLTTEESTAPIQFLSSTTYPMANAILLATATTENGIITGDIVDNRTILPFAQIQLLVSAVGLPYEDDDTISERLDALETAVSALQAIVGTENSGNTLDTLPVSASDSTNAKAYVDAQNAAQNTVIQNNFNTLQTAIATGGTSSAQTGFEQLAEELASQDVGVTQINPHWAKRSTASRVVIDVWGDGTDGSPADLNAGTATIDHDAGTIGP